MARHVRQVHPWITMNQQAQTFRCQRKTRKYGRATRQANCSKRYKFCEWVKMDSELCRANTLRQGWVSYSYTHRKNTQGRWFKLDSTCSEIFRQYWKFVSSNFFWGLKNSFLQVFHCSIHFPCMYNFAIYENVKSEENNRKFLCVLKLSVNLYFH